LSALEGQEAKLGSSARQTLDEAQRNHITAQKVLQEMELALYESQETLIIARKLKEFEDKKIRHRQVIKYAETYEKLS